jgi:hypothetical protein
MPNDEVDRAKDLLLKMYLKLKIRKNEDSEESEKEENLEEKHNLKKMTLIELIDYISKYIYNLISLKSNAKTQEKRKDISEEDSSKEDKNLAEQYEELLIKAENDIRKHIKVSCNIF